MLLLFGCDVFKIECVYLYMYVTSFMPNYNYSGSFVTFENLTFKGLGGKIRQRW